jgi:rhodanese-related sulfurtransferase
MKSLTAIELSKNYIKLLPKIKLIDVRTNQELLNTGLISTAKHIPFNQLQKALTLSSTEFYQNYNFHLDKTNDIIVFYCKIGQRSHYATLLAKQLGFKNSINLIGGIDEYNGIIE